MGISVVSSVVDSCCEVCWLSSVSSPVVASSFWLLFELLSIMLVLVSVVGYTIYGITFGLWIMATPITRPFNYSYLIQLLMWPTLKVLKHVNCNLRSSQKFSNETGKTLRDHFWCSTYMHVWHSLFCYLLLILWTMIIYIIIRWKHIVTKAN